MWCVCVHTDIPHTSPCVCMHTVNVHCGIRECVGVAQCVRVYACTVVTSITQSRELQSVKPTLTFMVLTSQGHPKAEHLEWSVTFQTENNSRVFSALWRRLFILSLTLIHFDLARGNNRLNTFVGFFSFAWRLSISLLNTNKSPPDQNNDREFKVNLIWNEVCIHYMSHIF